MAQRRGVAPPRFVDDCPLPCCAPRPLAVVDVETTGLDPREDRVVEVAVVRCDPDGVPEAPVWHTRVDPGELAGGASFVHGLGPAELAGAPAFADVAGDVVDLLAGRTVVAHNAYFDVRFLTRELRRAARLHGALESGGWFPLLPVMCTMHSARVVGVGGGMPSLAAAAWECGVELVGAHAAAGDARACAEVARVLLRRARAEGGHVHRFGDPATPPLRSGDWAALPRGAATLPREVAAAGV